MAAISWATVGITWVFCTITNVLILLAVWGIISCRRKRRLNKKKLPPFVREVSAVSAGPSDRSSKISHMSNRSQSSSSTRPILRSQNSQNDDVNKNPYVNGNVPKTRIHSDLVAKWCSEHGLSEHTAHVLRQNGFTTTGYLESLHTDVISALGLNTKAEECRLREVLESKRQKTHQIASQSLQQSKNTNSRPERPRLQMSTSLTEESIHSLPNDREDSGVSTSLLNKTTSSTAVDETDGPILPSAVRQRNPRQKRLSRELSHDKGFRGILSDQGLYDLSGQIGMEWQHMATLLHISTSVQDQIKMNYPYDAKKQIFEALRLWRDTVRGSKEEVKGKLTNVLEKLGRKDLAELLMREAVDGSQEKISTHSIV